MKFNKTDGGRSRSKTPKETNDCAVRAFAIATDKSYDSVRLMFRSLGRKWGEGVDTYQMRKALGFGMLMNLEITSIEEDIMQEGGPFTISEFTKLYPNGRFLVETATHFSACIDGVYQEEGPKKLRGQKICSAWLIEKL